jgi:hypothetical protein
MCRLFVAILLEAVLSVPVFAQDINNPEATGLALPPAASGAAAVDAAEPAPSHVIRRLKHKRPSSLPMLYAGATALQSYDTALTLGLIEGGYAHETNPMMKTVVQNPVVFVALKTGVTVTAILAAEHLWKNHNRTGAVALMIATNVIMGVVAVHNTRAVP